MKSMLLITVALVAGLFSSCNTMIGIGRDLRMGGEGLESSANKAAGGSTSSSSTTTGNSAAPVY